ncbi:hypothetical protein ACFWG0_27650 [Streptomyces yangpuensis]|uniref:hypothetical protein n=1 Tax=Streptomyces yangpuensis TaxID=1648182 RepID=UPI00364ABF07
MSHRKAPGQQAPGIHTCTLSDQGVRLDHLEDRARARRAGVKAQSAFIRHDGIVTVAGTATVGDDIDSGADPEQIQYSLYTSGLLRAAGALTQAPVAFAEQGEEDQTQRASARHLREADQVLGHGQAGDERPTTHARTCM